MSSRAENRNPLDHALRHSLRREVRDLGAEPKPDVRARLLQRAARVDRLWRWLAWLKALSAPSAAPSASPWLDLGWREMALAQALRPAGLYGPVSFQLR